MAKKKKRRPTSEAALDLANLRKLKRLTKRVYRGLESMERYILRMAGGKKRQGQPSDDDLEVVRDFYEDEPEEV